MDVSIMELVRTLAAFDVGTKSDLAVAMEHVGNINEINDVLQHISLGSAKNQLNYLSLIPIIGNASAKGISKDEITNYLLYITKGAIANHIENVYLVFNEQEQINKVKDVVTVDLSKYNDEDSYLNDNYYAIW
eukprot:282689_1